MLSVLPDDVIGDHIAGRLDAPDLLNLLCSSRELHRLGTGSVLFWERLLDADDDDDGEGEDGGGGGGDVDVEGEHGGHSRDGGRRRWRSSASPHSSRGGATGGGNGEGEGAGMEEESMDRAEQQRQRSDPPDEAAAVQAAKMRYLIRAHASSTQPLSVRWHPVMQCPGAVGTPKAREGHLMCVLGDLRRRGERRRVVLTGGFCDDDSVHVLDLPRAPPDEVGSAGRPRGETGGKWFRCPHHAAATAAVPSVYGATLTALDSQRAVHFGGFRGGGYTGETNDVHVLTVRDAGDGAGGGGGGNNNDAGAVASWRRVRVGGDAPVSPRAYHTATLINRRYLLVLGGMTSSRGSILDPALLDCETWTWLPCPIATGDGNGLSQRPPEGRHGHSVVLDGRRDRLVLFGGGSGSDLLRSGRDNTEVYELDLGDAGWREDLVGSLPWTWRPVHGDRGDIDDYWGEHSREEEGEGDNEERRGGSLSPSERLCLGRCHLNFKIAPDLVLFAFGSGNPSTNGVLAYDLRRDTFRRPAVDGPLPAPRFSSAGVHLDVEGWIVAHGGFHSQGGRSIDEVAVLDLAPALPSRWRVGSFAPPLPSPPPAAGVVAPSNGPVDDGDALNALGRSRLADRMVSVLAFLPARDRREAVAEMLRSYRTAQGRRRSSPPPGAQGGGRGGQAVAADGDDD